jgi:hypothetical protein
MCALRFEPPPPASTTPTPEVGLHPTRGSGPALQCVRKVSSSVYQLDPAGEMPEVVMKLP